VGPINTYTLFNPSNESVEQMARKRPLALRAGSPPASDDFKRIRGIGPAIESRLHRAGIGTFARLAALSPDEVAALIANLSAERIAKQGWIRQARKLAPKQPQAKLRKKEATATIGGQHYANFTVELLLDENDEARRTRVVHVQSGDTDTWAGWEAERLVDFLARRTGVRSEVAKPVPLVAIAPELRSPITAAVEPVPQVAAMPEPAPPMTTPVESVPQTAAIAYSVPPATSIAEPTPAVRAMPEPVLPVAALEAAATDEAPPTPVRQMAAPTESILSVAAGHRPSPPTPTGLSGILRLHGLETVPTSVNKPQSILPQGQAFEVRLNLDLTNVTVTGNQQLNYAVAVYAKNLGGGPRQVVGETQGIIEFSESIIVIVNGTVLPQGLYRLDTMVTLAPASTTSSPLSSLRAWLEGGLLQIY
jgi:predicted flap endonuclease-1-like 5' DNA nuclease